MRIAHSPMTSNTDDDRCRGNPVAASWHATADPWWKMANTEAEGFVIDDPPRQPPGDTSVYLMRNHGMVKIGFAREPEGRARQIEYASGMPTEVVYSKVVANHREVERMLHERYAAYRTMGEWFDLDAWQVDEIIETLRMLG